MVNLDTAIFLQSEYIGAGVVLLCPVITSMRMCDHFYENVCDPEPAEVMATRCSFILFSC